MLASHREKAIAHNKKIAEMSNTPYLTEQEVHTEHDWHHGESDDAKAIRERAIDHAKKRLVESEVSKLSSSSDVTIDFILEEMPLMGVMGHKYPIIGVDGKYHYLYFIIHIDSKKLYIGKHSTIKLKDNYFF